MKFDPAGWSGDEQGALWRAIASFSFYGLTIGEVTMFDFGESLLLDSKIKRMKLHNNLIINTYIIF
jgi:hypothetical protein